MGISQTDATFFGSLGGMVVGAIAGSLFDNEDTNGFYAGIGMAAGMGVGAIIGHVVGGSGPATLWGHTISATSATTESQSIYDARVAVVTKTPAGQWVRVMMAFDKTPSNEDITKAMTWIMASSPKLATIGQL